MEELIVALLPNSDTGETRRCAREFRLAESC
jgi:hypothetical protein